MLQSPFFSLLKQSRCSFSSLLVFFLFAIGCLCASCRPEPEVKAKEVKVSITFEDFEVTYQEDSSNKSNPQKVSNKDATQAQIDRISLAIFNTAGQLAFSDILDIENNPDIPLLISCMLLPGDYTFVAVAHQTAEPTDAAAVISSPTQATITTSKCLRVYTYSQTVTILADQPNSVVVDFGKRVSSTVQFCTTDGTPEEVYSCELIINSSKSESSAFIFNPTTGFASSAYQYKAVHLKSNYEGTFQNAIMNVHFLLTENPESVDLTVNMMDASGAIVRTRTFSNIEAAPHRCTRLTGSFFHSSVESSFIFDTVDDPRVDLSF